MNLIEQNLQKIFCEKHQKEIEAFCENEKCLVCIKCILEEHSKHELSDVKGASQKQRQLIVQVCQSLGGFEQTAETYNSQIKSIQANVQQEFQNSQNQIQEFFSKIQKVITNPNKN